MAAYDYILNFSSKSKLKDYRQALVSHKRGTLSNGSFCVAMSLQYKKDMNNAQEDLFEASENDKGKPIKIYQRIGVSQYPGLIFNHNGTEQITGIIASNGNVKLFEDFSDQMEFLKQEDQQSWFEMTRIDKRKCFSRNIEEMIKKTDINYRTHGDRMHYIVLGLVKIVDMKGDSSNYPLYLFSCTDLNKNTLVAEVEQEGFINFWLDKYILENNLLKANGGFSLNLDGDFAAKMNMVSAKLAKLQSSQFESISVDPQYSSLSIVTGFEAEYIDPAWTKILEN